MTHTPGPWRRGTGRDSVVCDTEIPQFKTGDEGSLRAYGGHLVAESIESNNLHIIAAAPEMLEALERMLANYTSDGSEGAARDIELASAAIAKARGTT